jgi:hypothetical protein
VIQEILGFEGRPPSYTSISVLIYAGKKKKKKEEKKSMLTFLSQH